MKLYHLDISIYITISHDIVDISWKRYYISIYIIIFTKYRTIHHNIIHISHYISLQHSYISIYITTSHYITHLIRYVSLYLIIHHFIIHIFQLLSLYLIIYHYIIHKSFTYFIIVIISNICFDIYQYIIHISHDIVHISHFLSKYHSHLSIYITTSHFIPWYYSYITLYIPILNIYPIISFINLGKRVYQFNSLYITTSITYLTLSLIYPTKSFKYLDIYHYIIHNINHVSHYISLHHSLIYSLTLTYNDQLMYWNTFFIFVDKRIKPRKNLLNFTGHAHVHQQF